MNGVWQACRQIFLACGVKLPGDWGVGACTARKRPVRWLLTQRKRAWVDGLKGMALLEMELLDC